MADDDTLRRLLIAVSEATFGSRWHDDVATALGIRSARRVTEMAEGRRPVQPGHVLDLCRVALQRAGAAVDLVERAQIEAAKVQAARRDQIPAEK